MLDPSQFHFLPEVLGPNTERTECETAAHPLWNLLPNLLNGFLFGKKRYETLYPGFWGILVRRWSRTGINSFHSIVSKIKKNSRKRSYSKQYRIMSTVMTLRVKETVYTRNARRLNILKTDTQICEVQEIDAVLLHRAYY